MMSDGKTEYSFLKADNNRCVINDAMFEYALGKINILLSILIVFLYLFKILI